MNLSVIVPAYNAVETLAESLQSAIGQMIPVIDPRYPRGGAWPDGPALIERMSRALGRGGEAELLGPLLEEGAHGLEILVVNDGSGDDTLEVARELAAHTPAPIEVRVLDKPNGGPASARNYGIRHARGEFVAFLDADDLWAPRKLRRQLDALPHGSQHTFIYSDTRYFRHSGIYNPPGLATHLRRGGDLFEALMLHGNFVPNLTVVARRDALDEVTRQRGPGAPGPFDEDPEVISSEDYDLWLRLSTLGHAAYVREPLAWYRVHAGGLNWRRIGRSHHAAREVTRRMAAHPRATAIPRPQLDARMAQSWYEQGYENAEAGQPREALRCHLRSLFLHPTPQAARGVLRNAVQSLPGLASKPRSVADRGRDDVSFVS